MLNMLSGRLELAEAAAQALRQELAVESNRVQTTRAAAQNALDQFAASAAARDHDHDVRVRAILSEPRSSQLREELETEQQVCENWRCTKWQPLLPLEVPSAAAALACWGLGARGVLRRRDRPAWAVG